jgi:hypothetical protein
MNNGSWYGFIRLEYRGGPDAGRIVDENGWQS